MTDVGSRGESARVPLDGGEVRSAQCPVADDLAAAAAARRFVAEVLNSWDVVGGTTEDAILLASELVTNAVRHGQPPVGLRLRQTAGAVTLEVSDHAPFLPRRLRPGLDDEHGRGLLLVSRLAERWGVRPTPTGKAVWCALPLT